jgi:Rieske Fe-S protein
MFAWARDAATGTVRSGTRLNQLLVVRLDPATLRPETAARAPEGIAAYTAICTHQGCEVDDWLADEQLLHCACHSSTFDPRDGARVIEGEARRPLPALPLTIANGRLVVAAPFTSRVGFESA